MTHQPPYGFDPDSSPTQGATPTTPTTPTTARPTALYFIIAALSIGLVTCLYLLSQ